MLELDYMQVQGSRQELELEQPSLASEPKPLSFQEQVLE